MARTEEKSGMENAIETSAMRKIYLRLLPFAVLSYFLAYIDRINVSLAGLRMRARHLLLGLLGLRAAEQFDHGESRRAFVDRPHHDHLGHPGGPHRHGHRLHQLWDCALSARRRRGRVLPWAHSLFYLLVPELPPCPHCFGLSDGVAHRGRTRRADLDRAPRPGRLARSARLAGYVHCRGHPARAARVVYLVRADRPAGAGKVPLGGREDLARPDVTGRTAGQRRRGELYTLAGG